MIPAFLWVGCKGKKETYQDIVRPVRVVNVESLGAINKLYTGVVEAEEYSNLAFKLSGPLVAMNVDEGHTHHHKQCAVPHQALSPPIFPMWRRGAEGEERTSDCCGRSVGLQVAIRGE